MVLYNETASATGFAYVQDGSTTGSLVSSSATATASSTISPSDAYNKAYSIANSVSQSVANNNANIIDQAVKIVQNSSSGYTGPQGSTGPQGPTGYTGYTGPKGDSYNTSTITAVNINPSSGPVTFTVSTGLAYITGNSVVVLRQSDSSNRFEGTVTSYSSVSGLMIIGNIVNITGTFGSSYVYNVNLDGIDGPQGATGYTGYTGPQGLQGVTGYTGYTGPQGLQGVTGYTGYTGPQGLQGVTGYTGYTGPQGLQGVTGYTGYTGPQGLQGVTGYTGYTGPQGIQGVTGYTGYTGPQGLQGATGVTGYTGPQGVTGPTGFIQTPTSTSALNTGQTGVVCYNPSNDSYTYSTDATKTFVIDHPTNSDKYLVHACIEGPEAGVYYRGESEITNNKHVIIELPDYVENLAKKLTIQITPIYSGSIKTLNVSKVENNKFTVYGENCEFFWTVFGQRASINVEPNKTDVQLKGTGPYLWI